MARKQIVELTDDIDGSPATQTLHFAVEGVEYEIDVSEKNAKKFHSAIAPYVANGRRVSARSRVSGRKRSASGVDARAVREWASQRGIHVNARGRVPGPLVDSYLASVG
jgi:hypothetical protein